MPPREQFYRFHGRTPPEPGSRQPLQAQLQHGGEQDGVATLRLYDPIDSWGGDWGVSAKEFAAALDSLGEDVNELRLHINSPGGEVFEGIAILNSLRNDRRRVVTVVDGLAASAASFIAMAGDEIVMGRNSQMMIHDAWGICIGNAEDMRDLGTRLDHLSDNLASIYAGRAGGDVASWRSVMLAETWYSADEAVDAGLADRVEDAPVPQNKHDLSVFTYAGRENAPAPAPPIPDAPAATVRPRLMRARHEQYERRMRSAG
jgi:ATP-dependent protease ClpP protease subunit